MAAINRVVLVGNLTKDPELRHTPGGTAVCSLRLAVNSRQKDASTGEWTEKPNYFDVTVWDKQGENCAQYLSKGRPVAVDGRLDWREWDAQDGTKRQAVQIIASTVQFLGSRGDAEGGGQPQFVPAGATAGTDADMGGSSGASDDDIPFYMARDREQKERQGGRRRAPMAAPGRRRPCYFCKEKVEEVDWKNFNQLRRHVSEKGKIRSRRITGTCRRHQRQVAAAVKRAREMALLPYVTN
jgi:single-strand DNA-binding protein